MTWDLRLGIYDLGFKVEGLDGLDVGEGGFEALRAKHFTFGDFRDRFGV